MSMLNSVTGVKMTNLHQYHLLVYLVASKAFQVRTNQAVKTWLFSRPQMIGEVGDLLVLSDWSGGNSNFKGMYAVI